jgi:hypothetical protein
LSSLKINTYCNHINGLLIISYFYCYSYVTLSIFVSVFEGFYFFVLLVIVAILLIFILLLVLMFVLLFVVPRRLLIIFTIPPKFPYKLRPVTPNKVVNILFTLFCAFSTTEFSYLFGTSWDTIFLIVSMFISPLICFITYACLYLIYS